MDPFSLTVGAMALIQVANKVVLACYRLQKQIKGLENDIAALIQQVEALAEISEDLSDIFEQCKEDELPKIQLPTNQDDSSEPAPAACRGVLNACVKLLNEMADQLEPLSKSRVRSKLKWPFESSALNEKLDIIEKHKSTLQLALSAYQTKIVKRQASKLDHSQNQAKRVEVLRWYKTSDPERNYRLCKEEWEPDTGLWIFEDERFKQWKEAHGKLLWLHGIPGAGKTMLCSTIINHLLSCTSSSDEAGPQHHVGYFYFDFSDSSKQNVTNLLKSIIFQLITLRGDMSAPAESLYDAQNGGLSEPSLEELIEVCKAEAARTPTTYLLLDALDECPKSERTKFLDHVLGTMLESELNVLITSRKEPDIASRLKDVALSVVSLEASQVDADVRTHVLRVINRHSSFKSMKPALRKEILDGIVSRAHGM
ncbi:hypothetical protein ACHAPT_011744 [Fusarium lateritium]